MALRDKFSLRTLPHAEAFSDDEQKIFSSTIIIGSWIIVFGIIGVIIIGLWAFGIASRQEGNKVASFALFFGADLLVAAAAASVGALFGFVFGIPRTLDQAGQAAIAAAASQSNSPAVLSTNTNLERVSDWLTTLLIGATLVQIKDLVAWIESLGQKLLSENTITNDAVIPIIVVYFIALSFLGVYLITRLFLTSALQQSITNLIATANPQERLDQLLSKLDKALSNGQPEALTDALQMYKAWPVSPKDQDNPDLNLRLVYLLAKLVTSGHQSSTDVMSEIIAAASKATANPKIRAKLKSELQSGQLVTGTQTSDDELTKALWSTVVERPQ